MMRVRRKVRRDECSCPFVVQVAVPEGGFGRALDTINAWHRYNAVKQRMGQPRRINGQQYWCWCFKDVTTAEFFQRRFGGELLTVKPPARP